MRCPNTRGLEIAAVRGDVGIEQQRHVGEILTEHDMAGGAELADIAIDLHGVPDQPRVRQQAEAAGLVHDFLVVAAAERALVGKEQPFREYVAELAAIQVELDLAAERFLMDVVQDVGLVQGCRGCRRG